MLRAILLGTGAVGGYLLLSLLAGPANADSGLLGDPLDGAGDTGIGLGEVIEELPVPDLGAPPEPVDTVPAVPDPPEPAPDTDSDPAPDADSEPPPEPDSEPAPESDSEPAAGADEQPVVDADQVQRPVGDLVDSVTSVARDAGDLTVTVTGPVAGAVLPLPAVGSLVETAGHSVDQLVTGLAGTVESTVSPLTLTVDSLLPPLSPVVDEAMHAAVRPGTLPLSLTDPIAPTVDMLASSGAVPTWSTMSTDLPDARDGPDPPDDPPISARPPPRSAAMSTVPSGGVSAVPAAAGAEPAPVPARSPHPLPSTHQVAGQSFDHAHPWPLTRPSNVAAAPDIGLHRCVEDVTHAGLVMSISAPPG